VVTTEPFGAKGRDSTSVPVSPGRLSIARLGQEERTHECDDAGSRKAQPARMRNEPHAEKGRDDRKAHISQPSTAPSARASSEGEPYQAEVDEGEAHEQGGIGQSGDVVQ
jgi:hypothetical protein